MERPQHALDVHPYVVEAPLWVVWRMAHLGTLIREWVSSAMTALREMDTESRLHAIAMVLSGLVIVLTAVVVYLLLVM